VKKVNVLTRRSNRLAQSAVVLSYLFSFTKSANAQDFQSWNEVDLAASWRNVEFVMPLLARTDIRLPNPQLAATGITADVHLPWRLTLTGGYLFADLPQRSELADVPLFAVSKTFHASRLFVTDRNRFEKLIGFGTSPIRYRNRLLVDLPFGTRGRWHVFADDEVFFDLSASKWNQNRFRAGCGAQLSSRLFLDVYYLQRNPAGGVPETRVVGTVLKVTLTSFGKEGKP
jgi:hypothetical protein